MMKSQLLLPQALICGLLLLCFSSNLVAQEMKSQKFVVHEDVVLPNKMMEYEKASKSFVETLSKHAGTEAQFMALSTDDMRYIFISPIENMAALDKSPFAKMDAALGKDAAKEVWSSWDGLFETHKDYIINLSTDLSYNSGAIMEDGINYRHMVYYYLYPDKEAEAKTVAKEWKALYAAKKVPYGYRIYTGGMGTEPMIMVTRWAKDASTFHAQNSETLEMLGDEAGALYQRTLALTKKIETVDGQMRPELSFMPATNVADQ